MLTGQNTLELKAGEPASGRQRTGLLKQDETIAEKLYQTGYETVAWTNNPHLVHQLGISQGFTRYFDYGTRHEKKAAKIAAEDISNYLKESKAAKRFLFIHLLDPHYPYHSPEQIQNEFLSKKDLNLIKKAGGRKKIYNTLVKGKELSLETKNAYKKLHLASIRYVDYFLADLFKKITPENEVLFIYAADHGEEFFEHGKYEHGHSLYDELLKVPLLVHDKSVGKALEIDETVSTNDIFPTILDYADLKPASHSLLQYEENSSINPDRNIYSYRLKYGKEKIAIEQDKFKLIYTMKGSGKNSPRAFTFKEHFELYDIRKDSLEKNNIFRQNIPLAKKLYAQLIRKILNSFSDRYFLFLSSDKIDNYEVSLKSGASFSFSKRLNEFVFPEEEPVSSEYIKRNKSEVLLSLKARKVLLVIKPKKSGTFDLEIKKNGKLIKRLASGNKKLKAPFSSLSKENLKITNTNHTINRILAASSENILFFKPGSKKIEKTVDMDPDFFEQLRSLGYLN